jgi:dihydrofolate synthase / folylpolyglutamate synthase
MVTKVYVVGIPGEENAHSAEAIAEDACAAGFDAELRLSVKAALRSAARVPGARVVICGSLYLAGHVLALNGTPPD